MYIIPLAKLERDIPDIFNKKTLPKLGTLQETLS